MKAIRCVVPIRATCRPAWDNVPKNENEIYRDRMKKKNSMIIWIGLAVLGALGVLLYFRSRAARFDSAEVQGAIKDKSFLDGLDDRGKEVVSEATITQASAEEIAAITKEKLSASLFNWRSKNDKKEVENAAARIKNYGDLYLVQQKFGTFNGRDYVGTLIRFLDEGSGVLQNIKRYASEN